MVILVLNVLSIGLAQQITTITTTVTTYPPSMVTETSVVPGTIGVATIAHGGYKPVYIEMGPDWLLGASRSRSPNPKGNHSGE